MVALSLLFGLVLSVMVPGSMKCMYTNAGGRKTLLSSRV